MWEEIERERLLIKVRSGASDDGTRASHEKREEGERDEDHSFDVM